MGGMARLEFGLCFFSWQLCRLIRRNEGKTEENAKIFVKSEFFLKNNSSI
jgi:hypothetical protein